MNPQHFTLLIVALFLALVAAFPSLSPAENHHKSAQIYVFGGRDNHSLSSASHYNSSTGVWTKTTPLSQAKDLYCGVAVGTKIYLFGGFDYPAHDVFATAEVYDAETGDYSSYGNLPYRLWKCAAAVLDGYIYVSGGSTGSGPSDVSDVFRFNIQTSLREMVSPMNVDRSAHELVELGGLLYALGGYNRVNSTEVYNATTGQWTMLSNMNTGHGFFSATAHEGKIFVLDGHEFEMYSPETDQWHVLPPLETHSGDALVSMNGKLWAVGGSGGGNLGNKSVSSYDTNTRQWTEEPEMDVARYSHKAFVVYQ